MKKIALFVILFIPFLIPLLAFSQKNINYKFTVNTTFTANENFGNYDEFWDETDWTLIVPRAILLRNGFDVEVA